MKKSILLIIISVVFMITTGCSYNTGVTTSEPVSYLYFTGDAEDVEVFIDGISAFVVTETGNKELYKISPGKHVITIKKDDQVLVKRILLLGDGHEKELNVPAFNQEEK
jgi:phage-related protein